MNKVIALLIVALSIFSGLQAQEFEVEGRVLSQDDKLPLPGATIRLAENNQVWVTGEDGGFSFGTELQQMEITVSFIGFQTQRVRLSLPLREDLGIYLIPDQMNLQGVDVYATGYQQVPKERQTGSFVGLDETLVNRRVSTSVLDRLEDVTPGLIFNRNGASTDKISIRGRATLFSDAAPLIVIDNFPYAGPVENINPNDVESISVLRDAAAASIWGARAGNGVIVITTKSGKKGQAMRVNLTANSTWIERPDPFYRPLMGSSEVVEMEQLLFGQDYYDNLEKSPSRVPLSPVVEQLILHRDGQLSAGDLSRRLEEFAAQDVRNDYRDYLYQTAWNQQYNLNLRGGADNYRYFISAGWDKNRENLQTNSGERTTLLSNQSLSLLDGKLELGLGINYIRNQSKGSNEGPSSLRASGTSPLYAYARLVEEGTPVGYYPGIREGFAREAEADGLLSWQLNPLEELGLVNRDVVQEDVRLNLSANYQLTKGLTAELYYQFWKGNSRSTTLSGKESFVSRDLINRFTQVDDSGVKSYPVPLGGILDLGSSQSRSDNFRSLLRLDRQIGAKSQVNALAGYEVQSLNREGFGMRYYGYNEETGITAPVDYQGLYPQYPSPAIRSRIPFGSSVSGTADNFISWFMNGSYSYADRYTMSFSARKDASNLFGVETNQKAVPLWSTGLAWTITGENWNFPSWMSFLRLRTTYGINGNVNKSIAALTTSRIVGTSRYTSYPVANLNSPPNPNLRWEQIKILNLGTDFDFWDGRLSGTVEYYRKKGEDLIGDIPFAPNTGVDVFRGNFANTLTKGFDLQLSSVLIDQGIRWELSFFHSHVREKVEKYEVETTVLNYLGQATGADPSSPIFPLTGRPLYAVYSLPFVGLDPENGDPLGLLDGAPSSDYAAIINGVEPSDMIYHGAARPTHFGAIRNTLSWKNWNLSANITYRLGYYYRRNSVRYLPVLAGEQGHGDFSKRWLEPGDELLTQVPSLPSSRNSFRDNFYSFSSALVEKGDHIRLQDIRLGYVIPEIGASKQGNLELFTYINNLGILWKASGDPLDPDYRSMKPLRSFTFGLRFHY